MSNLTDEKRVQWSWEFLSQFDDSQRVYSLTERQARGLLNVIRQMQWETRWTDAPANRDARMAFVADTAHNLMTPDSEIETDEGCIEYSALASHIQYHPAPPDVTPTNYASPAWLTATDTIPPAVTEIVERYGGDLQGIIGFEAGDVYTHVLNIPRPVYTGLDPLGWLSQWVNHIRSVITNGLPRISVELTGTGIVELHLLKIPVGGAVAVGVDIGTDPVDLALDLVIGSVGASAFNAVIDLERDIIQAPPETGGEQIHEIEITQAGTHTIDIVFIPTWDDELPIFKFGGGLRRIVACGFDTPAPIDGGANLPFEMRLNGCTLEYQLLNTDGTIYQAWTPVQGWDTGAQACFKGDPGQDGQDGLSQQIIVTPNGFGVDNTGDGIPDQTIDFSGSEPNVLPPPSTITEDDKICSAATYIAQQVTKLVDDTVADAASITLSEFLASLLGLGGFDASLLNQLWDYAVANLSGLQSQPTSAYEDDLADALYVINLDRASVDLSSIPEPQRSALSAGLDSVTDGKYALWATVGAEAGLGDCTNSVLITFDTPYPAQVASITQLWNSDRSVQIAGDLNATADGNPAPSWQVPQGDLRDNGGNPNRYGWDGILTITLDQETSLTAVAFDYKFWQPTNNAFNTPIELKDAAGTVVKSLSFGNWSKEQWNSKSDTFAPVNVKTIEMNVFAKYFDSSWDATTGIYAYIDNIRLTGDF